MSVAPRRSRLGLWSAWVVAAAIGGAALAGLALTTLPSELVWIPWLMLQYLVVRGFAILSRRTATLWLAASAAAVIVSSAADAFWFTRIIPAFAVSPATADLLFGIAAYFYPLLFGIAQGVVLSSALHPRVVGLLWLGANLGAWFAVRAIPIPPSLFDSGLGTVVYMTIYAAFTGLVLVLIVWMRAPVAAPQRPRPAV